MRLSAFSLVIASALFALLGTGCQSPGPGPLAPSILTQSPAAENRSASAAQPTNKPLATVRTTAPPSYFDYTYKDGDFDADRTCSKYSYGPQIYASFGVTYPLLNVGGIETSYRVCSFQSTDIETFGPATVRIDIDGRDPDDFDRIVADFPKPYGGGSITAVQGFGEKATFIETAVDGTMTNSGEPAPVETLVSVFNGKLYQVTSVTANAEKPQPSLVDLQEMIMSVVAEPRIP